MDNLAEESPIFQVDEQQNLTIELETEIDHPTRFSYTTYERNGESDSTSISTQNVKEGVIEVVGDMPKTYVVRAEWYSEDNEKLLGSIYTIFTLEN